MFKKMKKELINLYQEFLKEMIDYNENKREWLQDNHKPTFELFMKWLINKENG